MKNFIIATALILCMLLIITFSTMPVHQPEPPYVLMREVSGQKEFFTWIDRGRGLEVDLQESWVSNPSMAYEFGAMDSAIRGKDAFGGEIVEKKKAGIK